MALFRSIVFSALIAGLLTGILATGLHFATTVPLIAQAETFEHETSEQASASTREHDDHHSHDVAPSNVQRSLLTLVAMVLTFVGFALIMSALGAAFGSLQGWRNGLLWGLAGFVAFTVAPGIGLPPELPAMPAAELEARQVWWLATVACTVVGMAIAYRFRHSASLFVLGVVIALVPQLLGAPQPIDMASPIPADLHSSFVTLTFAVSLVSWCVMGMILGSIWKRWNDPAVSAMTIAA